MTNTHLLFLIFHSSASKCACKDENKVSLPPPLMWEVGGSIPGCVNQKTLKFDVLMLRALHKVVTD